MFDIAWTEILVIAVVAILVIGPRDLPKTLRSVGSFMGQMRRMAGDFQKQFNDALREAELDEVKRGIEGVRKANPASHIRDNLNPLKQAGDSIRDSIEGKGGSKPASAGTAAKSEAPAAETKTAVAAEKATPAAPAKKTAAAPASKPARAAKPAPKPKPKSAAKPAAKKPAAKKPAAEKPASAGAAERGPSRSTSGKPEAKPAAKSAG